MTGKFMDWYLILWIITAFIIGLRIGGLFL